MNRGPKNKEPAMGRGKNDPSRRSNIWGTFKEQQEDPLGKETFACVGGALSPGPGTMVGIEEELDTYYSMVSEGNIARDGVRGVAGDSLCRAL